ncbi:hypothetical protein D915_002508, partial [Fasciola hepatica]
FLGHVTSVKSVKPSRENTKAIKEAPVRTDARQVKSFLEPRDISPLFTTRHRDGVAYYIFVYYDLLRRTLLPEAPEVELCQPAYQEYIKCKHNVIIVPSTVSGTVYFRILDAITPRFQNLTFIQTDVSWKVKPDSFEVFYDLTGSNWPGLIVTAELTGAGIEQASCRSADDKVVLVKRDKAWRPREAFDVVDVDVICSVSVGTRILYNLFPVQFVYNEEPLDSKSNPIPEVINLTDDHFKLEFHNKKDQCKVKGAGELYNRWIASKEGTYEILCRKSLIQYVYVLDFSKFAIHPLKSITYVTRPTQIKLSLSHPSITRKIRNRIREWRCFRLHPLKSEPVRELFPNLGYNKVACYFILANHYKVVTAKLFYLKHEHDPLIHLTGSDKVYQVRSDGKSKYFPIQLYFGSIPLNSSKFITCKGLPFVYPQIQLHSYMNFGLVDVRCTIPADTAIFTRKFRFNITLELHISPIRTTTCEGENLSFQCSCNLPDVPKSLFRMSIKHGLLGHSKTGQQIMYTVREFRDDLTVTCTYNARTPQTTFITLKMIEKLPLLIGFEPEGLEYYTPGVESLLTVSVQPPVLKQDPTLRRQIGVLPDVVKCAMPLQVNTSDRKPLEVCRELVVTLTLGTCPKHTEEFQLRVYGPIDLEITPRKTLFTFDRPVHKQLYTCSLHLPAETLTDLLGITWYLSNSYKSMFVTNGTRIYVTKRTSSGYYCVKCSLLRLFRKERNVCFTIFYQSHFRLSIKSTPDKNVITLGENGKWKCRTQLNIAKLVGIRRPKPSIISIEPENQAFNRTNIFTVTKFGWASKEELFTIKCRMIYEGIELLSFERTLFMADERKINLLMSVERVRNVSIENPIECTWESVVLRNDPRFRPVLYRVTVNNKLVYVGHKAYLTAAGNFTYVCNGSVDNYNRSIIRHVTVLPAPELHLIVTPENTTIPIGNTVSDYVCLVAQPEWRHLKPVWYAIKQAANAILDKNQLKHDPNLEHLVAEDQYTYLCSLRVEFGRYTYLLLLTRYKHLYIISALLIVHENQHAPASARRLPDVRKEVDVNTN